MFLHNVALGHHRLRSDLVLQRCRALVPSSTWRSSARSRGVRQFERPIEIKVPGSAGNVMAGCSSVLPEPRKLLRRLAAAILSCYESLLFKAHRDLTPPLAGFDRRGMVANIIASRFCLAFRTLARHRERSHGDTW